MFGHSSCSVASDVNLAGLCASSDDEESGGFDELPADLPLHGSSSMAAMPPDRCGEPIPTQLHHGSRGQVHPRSQSTLSHLYGDPVVFGGDFSGLEVAYEACADLAASCGVSLVHAFSSDSNEACRSFLVSIDEFLLSFCKLAEWLNAWLASLLCRSLVGS